jgi:hypothetical protein
MTRIGEDNVLSNLIKRFSWHKKKEKEMEIASRRVALTILRYKESSKEIQEEIERNRFARYLVYDKGDHHEIH